MWTLNCMGQQLKHMNSEKPFGFDGRERVKRQRYGVNYFFYFWLRNKENMWELCGPWGEELTKINTNH